jgi:hypothetical protein
MVGGCHVSQAVSSVQYGVSDAFLDKLNELSLRERSWWRDVLLRDDVFIAVRGNSLNVYHCGASIFRIDDVGGGKIRPLTHVKYLVRQQQHLAVLKDDDRFEPDNIGWSKYDGPKTLDDMIHAAAVLSGAEKTGLHPLVMRTSRVIDVELSLERVGDADAIEETTNQNVAGAYAEPTGNQDRLDVATLERRGDDVFVVFFEAKHFNNTELRAQAGNVPTVVDQIRRYRSTIKHHAASLSERYSAVCRALVRLDAMRRQLHQGLSVEPRNLDPLVHEAATKGIKLRIDPNPRLIVFGFDGDQRDGRWTAYLENITRAEPDLDVYAAGNPKKATGAFRPLASS